MSLIRPRWLEDVLKLTPSTSTRLRGLKSFEPHHVPAFQDVLYADDPIHWVLAADLVGAALNTGHIGVQTPIDDNIVCVVDAALISAPVADLMSIDVIEGGSILLALATDTLVVKRNRREQARTTSLERTGLLRIVDNGNAFAGNQIGAVRVGANTLVTAPIGHRLYGGEQLFVRNATANQTLTVTMWGRFTTKGQR